MLFTTILLTVENNIALLTVNRPDKMNALNKTVIDELSAALDEVYSNTEIKAAIITGAGPKAFVAGADISEFLSLNKEQGTELASRPVRALSMPPDNPSTTDLNPHLLT